MPFFTGPDWVVVILAAFAGIAGALGAWLQHRRGPDEDAAAPARRGKTFVVELGEESRRVISRMTDAMHDHGRRVGDAIGDHRDAIEDQTKVLKQKE